MHQCITRLLTQPGDEESLEALCRLLSTIGKELENPATNASVGRSGSNSNAAAAAAAANNAVISPSFKANFKFVSNGVLLNFK